MVGTAYLASAPGAAPFVKVGDHVNKGDTLLIIEAMKVMNPIRSPQSGRVSQLLVKDTDPVEFGTVLAIIE
jgi:acetyl-CoA carboxylase biotin carboxyl carrier protein